MVIFYKMNLLLYIQQLLLKNPLNDFVHQFEHIRAQAVQPLSRFLDYIT